MGVVHATARQGPGCLALTWLPLIHIPGVSPQHGPWTPPVVTDDAQQRGRRGPLPRVPPLEGRGMPRQGAPSVYFFKSISYIHAPRIYFFKSRKYIQAECRRGRRGTRGSAIAHPERPPDATSWDKSTPCPVRDAWDWVLTRSSAPSTTAGCPVPLLATRYHVPEQDARAQYKPPGPLQLVPGPQLY